MEENHSAYTLKELAKYYNVNTRTLYSWLVPIRQQLFDMNPIRKKRIRILIP